MKKSVILLVMAILISSFCACGKDNDEPQQPGNEDVNVPSNPKILVAYFSWSGTTQKMAQQIAAQTGGTLFEIVPVNPYPTDYTRCTEVARTERDTDARPAIKNTVDDMQSYDIVFIGCPVWWHTAPMIINTFTETYDFKGKIVVPFCTYASTYRDETLQRIVTLTPQAEHLPGLGLTGSGVHNADNVANWLKNIKVVKQ